MDKPALTTAFYETLLLQSNLLVFVSDQECVLTYVSESSEAILGYPPQQLTGKKWTDYLHPQEADIIKTCTFNKYKEPGTTYGHLRTATGNWLLMEFNCNSTGQGFVVILKKAASQSAGATKDLSYYHALFSTHPGFVFTISMGGIFEKVNTNVLQLLGYTTDHVAGHPYTLLSGAAFQKEIQHTLKNLTDRNPSFFEDTILTAAGVPKALRFVIVPVFLDEKKLGILGIARDISAEQAARRELEKLSLVASKAVSCVLITDAAGKTEWVNDEFTRVTGYTLQDAMGITPGQLLQGKDTDTATIQFMREKIRAAEPFYVEVINYRKNGEKFWFNMDIIPLFDAGGNLIQFFAIQNDIDERKKTQEKMRLLTEDLIRHNKDLQQFIYIVSHNLRAPVANILGLTSILENYHNSPEVVNRTIRNLKQTSVGLDTVIKDLNEILSVRNANGFVKYEKVSFKVICQEIINSLKGKLESINASVTIAIPARICVTANRAFLYSIFFNLITNAIKYRNRHRPLQITIRYISLKTRYEISVSDNGKGIDLEKNSNQLFKLYGKIDRQAEGRGIGLYMVKTQMEAINGTIKVESQPGEGTTFILCFRKTRASLPKLTPAS